MPSPTIAVNISTSGSLVAGSEFNLTCVVSELFTGLTGSPVATWTAANNAQLPGTVFTSSSNYGSVAVLSINPLRTSYPTSYTCRGSYFSPADNITRSVEETMDVLIQSEMLCIYVLLHVCLSGQHNFKLTNVLVDKHFHRWETFFCLPILSDQEKVHTAHILEHL